jgi:predicted GTPase
MGNSSTRLPSYQEKINTCINSNGDVDFRKLLEVKKQWELTECDIAVLGHSGVGKSSLINNLLGVPRKYFEEEYVLLICKHLIPNTYT